MSAALDLVGPLPTPATVEHVGVTPDELVYSSWWWDDALEFANDLAAATGLRHRVMWVLGYGWLVVPVEARDDSDAAWAWAHASLAADRARAEGTA